MIPATRSPFVARALAWAVHLWNGAGDNDAEVIPGRLRVGNIASAWDEGHLRRHGVTHIVAATQFGEAAVFHPSGHTYHVVEIQDVPGADLLGELAAAVAFIREALEDPSHRVLVHCNQGRSRSVTIVAAYLVAAHGMDPVPALEEVRRHRPQACPNPGFIAQLGAFHASLT